MHAAAKRIADARLGMSQLHRQDYAAKNSKLQQKCNHNTTHLKSPRLQERAAWPSPHYGINARKLQLLIALGGLRQREAHKANALRTPSAPNTQHGFAVFQVHGQLAFGADCLAVVSRPRSP